MDVAVGINGREGRSAKDETATRTMDLKKKRWPGTPASGVELGQRVGGKRRDRLCCAFCETQDPGTNAQIILSPRSDSWRGRPHHTPMPCSNVPIVRLERRERGQQRAEGKGQKSSIKLCRASCEDYGLHSSQCGISFARAQQQRR